MTTVSKKDPKKLRAPHDKKKKKRRTRCGHMLQEVIAVTKMKKKNKKKNRRRMVREDRFELLCDELISDILLRVPTKTLVRCKSVCKRWRSIISDDSFVKLFRSLPPPLAGFFYNDGMLRFQDLNSESHGGILIDLSKFSIFKSRVSVVASDNGLLLVRRKLKRRRSDLASYSIYNPLTQQSVCLPRHHSITTNDPFPLFISNSNGFKVVVFYAFQKNLMSLWIYSSEQQTWKKSQIHHDLGRFNVYKNYILSDGSVYLWDRNYTERLCLLDLEEESIHGVVLPSNNGYTYWNKCCFFGVSAGSLFYSENHTTLACYSVWVLVEGSKWSLKHSISYSSLTRQALYTLEHDVNDLTDSSPVAFHPLRPELLFVEVEDGDIDGLLLYNLDNRRMETCDRNKFRFFLSDDKDDFDDVFPYVLPSCLFL